MSFVTAIAIACLLAMFGTVLMNTIAWVMWRLDLIDYDTRRLLQIALIFLSGFLSVVGGAAMAVIGHRIVGPCIIIFGLYTLAPYVRVYVTMRRERSGVVA